MSDFGARATIGRDTTLCMSLAARPGAFGSRFHNHLYGSRRLDWIYKAFTTTDLAAAIGGVRALGIRGCAISMPWKEAVIPLLDGLAPSAARIGAVNTIVNEGGRLVGHNTDYEAVHALLGPIDPATRFVLRGAGGMARAVAAALCDRGFRAGSIVARNEAAGRALAATYGFAWQAAVASPAPLLINATPVGMAGGPDATTLAFAAAAIAAAEHVFEVVASPVETPLVRAARSAGKPVITGDRVLVLQGVAQFVHYTGQRPTDDEIAAAAAYALA